MTDPVSFAALQDVEFGELDPQTLAALEAQHAARQPADPQRTQELIRLRTEEPPADPQERQRLDAQIVHALAHQGEKKRKRSRSRTPLSSVALRLEPEGVDALDRLCSNLALSRSDLVATLVMAFETHLQHLPPAQTQDELVALATTTRFPQDQACPSEADIAADVAADDTPSARRQQHARFFWRLRTLMDGHAFHRAIGSSVGSLVSPPQLDKLNLVAAHRHTTPTQILREFIEYLASTWLAQHTDDQTWKQWPPVDDRPALLTLKHFKALNALKEHPRAGAKKSTKTLMDTLIDMRFDKDFPQCTCHPDGSITGLPEPDTLE